MKLVNSEDTTQQRSRRERFLYTCYSFANDLKNTVLLSCAVLKERVTLVVVILMLEGL